MRKRKKNKDPGRKNLRSGAKGGGGGTSKCLASMQPLFNSWLEERGKDKIPRHEKEKDADLEKGDQNGERRLHGAGGGRRSPKFRTAFGGFFKVMKTDKQRQKEEGADWR